MLLSNIPQAGCCRFVGRKGQPLKSLDSRPTHPEASFRRETEH